MKRLGFLALAALTMAAAPVNTARPTADVTAVSVRPASRGAELVVDVRGVVDVSDFVLSEPARVVVDLVGARLVAPLITYDGVSRGGIRNVRYSQFRSDVVRVVVELDSPRDYEVRQEDAAVRLVLSGAADAFQAWSSAGPQPAPGLAAANAAAPASEPAPLPAAIPPVRATRALEPVAPPQGPSPQPRVSATFDRTTIQEVVAAFASYSGRSIILGKEITGDVTAEIRDQPWDVAFNAILAGQGLAATELPGGIIRVDSRANLASQDSTEPLTTRIVPINYAHAASLQPSVAGVVTKTRGSVVADTVNNALIVTDLQSRIARVDSFIRDLDQRTPQVAIQARIVFVDRTQLQDIGLQYDLGTTTQFFNQLIQRPDPANPGTNYDAGQTIVNLGGNAVAAIANASAILPDGAPALKLVFSTVLGNYALSTFVQALQQVTLADVQAEPAVTVADNRPANIFSGERTPIRQVDVGALTAGTTAPRATTILQPTGITLRVTPHVVQGTREIFMDLHAERSATVASPISEIGAIFTSQEATTQLLVRDGETAVIGGLTVTDVTVTKSGIPFLVDLPVIGNLFGFKSTREERRDLLILVTPHIVDDLTTAGPGGQNH
jgi:type IV pilus assembly protein PilQ